jgi:hypothetical protein
MRYTIPAARRIHGAGLSRSGSPVVVLPRGGDPALMGPFDLGTGQGAPGRVAHDFGLGVQFDLEFSRGLIRASSV